jgi:hypothetical protein
VSLRQAIDPGPVSGEVPTRIGNYEIMGILGRGESATIYLGRELYPAREVAIKVYDPRRLSSEAARSSSRCSSRRRCSPSASPIPTSPRSTTRPRTTPAPTS